MTTLTRRTDPRGMPYVTVQARVTGPAHIDAFERICARTGAAPAALAGALIAEELRYIAMPRLRGQVRRARAARRAALDPAGDRR